MTPAPGRELLRNAAQLVALCGLALAQPLFDLLGKNPEFFAVRDASAGEVLAFAFGLVVVPPALLLAVEVVAGLAGPRVRRAVHLVLVAALVGVLALEALRRLSAPWPLLVGLAAAAGVAAAELQRRSHAVRSILTVLAVAPVAFLALFALQSRASDLILSQEGAARAAVAVPRRPAPVVLVVLDEFPTQSLLNARHRIDGARFPHFADLARHAYWFRNATTVHDGTTFAVPAILTGRYPRPKLLPLLHDYPQNLFTLLEGSYEIRASEHETHLCPPSACGSGGSFRTNLRSTVADASLVYLHLLLPSGLSRNLPSVSESWQGFLRGDEDEPMRFAHFLDSLAPSAAPTLYAIHVLLPHSPWQYLPSGRHYGVAYPLAPWGSDEVWSRDKGIVLQSFQRHLLQAAYVDGLLGRLLARLRATSLYDRALVIVTADHGISFRAGRKRRPVWPQNLQDIAFVPLFVKLPHERRGQIDDRHVQTIDILPTIAERLGLRVPWHLDGRSVFTVPRKSGLVRVIKTDGGGVSAPLGALEARRYRDLARQIGLFGSGTPASALYGVGRYRSLLGRRVTPAALRGGGTVTREHGLAALQVAGTVTGGASAVAVATAGRIRAVVPVLPYGGRREFWAFLPAPATHPLLLAVSGPSRRPVLRRLRG